MLYDQEQRVDRLASYTFFPSPYRASKSSQLVQRKFDQVKDGSDVATTFRNLCYRKVSVRPLGSHPPYHDAAQSHDEAHGLSQ